MLRTGAMRVHLAVALTFAGAHAASAEPRFHRLTPQLAARLAPKARSGLASVVELRDASGFLVHADAGSGRALLLTNEHVTRGGLASPEPVHFFDGAVAQARRVLHANASLDYSLVEIELPAGRAVTPLALEPAGLRAGRPIYTIAAYANLTGPGALGGGPAATAAVQNGPANQFAIATGAVDGQSAGTVWVNTGKGRILGVLSHLPNSPGMSGSPVLARDTHAVLGLHSAGTATPAPWTETSIPIALILQDVAAQLRGGAFDAAARPLVEGLLRATP